MHACCLQRTGSLPAAHWQPRSFGVACTTVSRLCLHCITVLCRLQLLVRPPSVPTGSRLQVVLMGLIEGYRVNGGPAGEGLDALYPGERSWGLLVH